MTLRAAKITYSILLIVLAALSLLIGVMETDWQIMVISRIPRTLAVIISGSALAICGTILQSLVRNRFVEPMTTGTGEGAALGILATLVFIPQAGLLVKMLLASGTALLTSFGFIAMVTRLPKTQPLLVPLVGIVYGGMIGAAMTFFAYQYDLLQYIGVWLTGGFSGVLQGRYELLWVAAALMVFSYIIADRFAIAGLGDAVSTGLGLNYKNTMLAGLGTTSTISALTVITVGIIPFVGLVAPNIIRERFGDNLRTTLPLVALLGASSVLACDILGRLIRFPYEIPVGVTFGVVGSIVFIWMLYRVKRYA